MNLFIWEQLRHTDSLIRAPWLIVRTHSFRIRTSRTYPQFKGLCNGRRQPSHYHSRIALRVHLTQVTAGMTLSLEGAVTDTVPMHHSFRWTVRMKGSERLPDGTRQASAKLPPSAFPLPYVSCDRHALTPHFPLELRSLIGTAVSKLHRRRYPTLPCSCDFCALEYGWMAGRLLSFSFQSHLHPLHFTFERYFI